jgi:hypothetical protein
MRIELSKKQFKTALEEHINKSMGIEEFEEFIVSLTRRYKKWYGSDVDRLILKIQGKDSNI